MTPDSCVFGRATDPNSKIHSLARIIFETLRLLRFWGGKKTFKPCSHCVAPRTFSHAIDLVRFIRKEFGHGFILQQPSYLRFFSGPFESLSYRSRLQKGLQVRTMLV